MVRVPKRNYQLSKKVEPLKLLPKPLSFISILALLVLMTGAGVLAQKVTSIVTRIKFAAGRTTAVARLSASRHES